jgi:hypothetical protein
LSTYFKPVLVLVISVLLFAGIAFLLDNELLDFVRTHFYNPSIVKTVTNETQTDAEIVQTHIMELQEKFASTLNEPSVRSSFLYNQSNADIFERSRIFGLLLETVSGLQSVQFIDSNGIRIHFSTSGRDMVNRTSDSTSYRNYTEDSRAMPFDIVSVGAGDSPKFTMDDSHDRIIFSFPFFDSMDIYRGTALFNLSVRAIAEGLIAGGRLKPTDDVSVIRIPPGVVFGSPDSSKDVILDQISTAWTSNLHGHITLDAEDSGVKYALISVKTEKNLFFGRLINDSVFAIPSSMKNIFLIAMFITFYLTLYFLINIKPNPVSVAKSRIKNLRANLFEQLYVNKSGQERVKWILELEQRRDEIRREIKYRLWFRKNQEAKIDELIDTAWDELLSVIKSGFDGTVILTSKAKQKEEKPAASEDEADLLEDIEEVEEIKDDFDEVSEAAEIDEIDEIEEIEELGEESPAVTTQMVNPSELVHTRRGLLSRALSFKARRGLLEKASKIKKQEETAAKAEEKTASKSLLKRASKYEIEEKIDDLEELEELEEVKPRTSAKPKGLLARATEEKEAAEEAASPNSHKGLLALAREIEFNMDYPVGEDEPEQDFIANMNVEVVSPFQSMFSTLKE